MIWRRGRADPDVTLIFLHLPKTGGTTLKSILQRVYREEEICALYRFPSREAVRLFGELPLEERERYRAVCGHMQYGIHRFVPGPSLYATLLRHPVDRAVSAYRYIVRQPTHKRHELVRGKTLETVLDRGLLPFLDNGQTRALCRTDAASIPYGSCTRIMLEEAKENVAEHIELAGPIEDFDALLLMLRERLGWGMVWYERRNQAPSGSPEDGDGRTESTVRAIREHNQLDLELYEFVCSRFRNRLAQAGPKFEKRLVRFRRHSALRSRLKTTGARR